LIICVGPIVGILLSIVDTDGTNDGISLLLIAFGWSDGWSDGWSISTFDGTKLGWSDMFISTDGIWLGWSDKIPVLLLLGLGDIVPPPLPLPLLLLLGLGDCVGITTIDDGVILVVLLGISDWNGTVDGILLDMIGTVLGRWLGTILGRSDNTILGWLGTILGISEFTAFGCWLTVLGIKLGLSLSFGSCVVGRNDGTSDGNCTSIVLGVGKNDVVGDTVGAVVSTVKNRIVYPPYAYTLIVSLFKYTNVISNDAKPPKSDRIPTDTNDLGELSAWVIAWAGETQDVNNFVVFCSSSCKNNNGWKFLLLFSIVLLIGSKRIKKPRNCILAVDWIITV
jgi:hypothetical protein